MSVFTHSTFSSYAAGADPGFAKWGTDHGERVEREPVMGVWGQSLEWGPGTQPLVGAESISSIFIQKGAKS